MKTFLGKLLKRPMIIQVSRAAARKMHSAAELAAPKETGGLLLGWWEHDSIVIDTVIVLADSAATETSWTRREAEAQKRLDALLEASRDQLLGYVGDWHSHPAPVGASSTDLQSLTCSSKQYQEPLVLMVRLSDGTLRPYVAKRGKLCTARLASSADNISEDQ
ncbi:Mov34/MPN/PAD-1 family protein [Rhodococcus sp. DMU2021]|uniref:Mov34/MPN/PAD-1 family protein n=1 Tax=Rhodococcus sp. DMU2021 TaxID=2866997 RepID=UPI001C7D76B8|nr:Mov34/MPN/PAD-1 family protein [Rhodococcus sp. DMU2021]